MTEPYRFKPLAHVTRTDSELVQRADDFYRLINQRRTVRDFSPKAVPATVIRSAIASAGTAPSGAHMQPWHFVAVSDPEKKQAIRIAAEKEERACMNIVPLTNGCKRWHHWEPMQTNRFWIQLPG